MKSLLKLVSAVAAVVAFVQSWGGGSERSHPSDGSELSDSGRGRQATSPSQIPPPGWKDIAKRVLREMKDDNLTTVAAAMTYYGILALFPALIAIVSIYGLIFDPAQVQAQITDLSALLPGSAAELVTTQVEDLVGTSNAALGFGVVASIMAALWTVSSGVSALIKSINLAYDETESRTFVRLRLVALGLTVGLVLFVVAALFVITALPAVLESMGVSPSAISLTSILRWPGMALLLMAGLAVLYRVAPNRDPAQWRWVSWGAAVAAILWLVASLGLNFYVANFASYNETYGALGGVVVLLLWMFVSALIVLLGAELDAEMEAQTRKDTTVGEPQPMGQRDAVKADHLGKRADLVDA